MRRTLSIIFCLILVNKVSHAQTQPVFPQLKTFQQTLSVLNAQFAFPRDFREIKTVHNADLDVDYAIELPTESFQVWFTARNAQQQRARLKIFEDDLKAVNNNPDSLFKPIAASTAVLLAGKDNYTTKTLPAEMLALFHADEGESYLLNLYNTPATSHYKYGLFICLQKNGTGCISMLFLSNDNGPDFYKNVNKTCYAIRFN